MLSLLISWAFTLAGLMIDSQTHALWVAIVLSLLGVFGTWFWNTARSHGNVALAFTELPHIALWVIFKLFPDVGNTITYYILVGLGTIVVVASLIIGSDSGSGSHTSQTGSSRAETDLSNLPGCIYSGTTCYGRRNSFGWGVEYVNESNSGDVITITNVYSIGNGEMSTNAGHFTY